MSIAVGKPIALVAVLSVGLAIAGPTLGKDKEEGPPKTYTDLQACRSIADEKARLTCFDTVSANMAKEVEAKDLVMLDRSAVRKTKRSLFGFNTPDIDFLKDDEKEPEFAKLETTIQSASGLGYGKWQFTVPEGSVWQTTEPSKLYLEAGDKIVISKGTLGGYFVKVGGGRSVRAKRVG